MTREAFGALLIERLPELRRRAFHVLRGYGDAEDVANETIARAWRAYQDGRYQEKGQLRHYLLRIVSNVAMDVLRAERPGKVVSLDQLVLSDTGHAQPLGDRLPSRQDLEHEVEVHQELEAVVLNMRLRERYVLTQLLSGRRHADIGRDLGLTEKSVASAVHRSRQRARKFAGLPPMRSYLYAARLAV